MSKATLFDDQGRPQSHFDALSRVLSEAGLIKYGRQVPLTADGFQVELGIRNGVVFVFDSAGTLKEVRRD